jgi:hypothetical protein
VIIRRYKKWAPLVLPTLLDALKDKDIDSVKGALHTLRVTLIEHTLARNSEYTENYVVGLIHAFESFDRVNPASKLLTLQPSVQNTVLSAINYLGRYNKQKAWITAVDEYIYEPIRPERPIDEKAIANIQSRREKKTELAVGKRNNLVCTHQGIRLMGRLN